MCTLTLYSGKKHCIVTMNRDEARTRHEPGKIHSAGHRGIRYCFPVDGPTGGTWFGVSSRGVALCLLNRYRGEESRSALSRGLIIPEALLKGGFNDISAWLEALPCERYNPFDLFLIKRRALRRYSWNGNRLRCQDPDMDKWAMFTSSLVGREEVVAYRDSLFRAWREEMGAIPPDPEEILRGFHLIQMPGMESQSVLMERERSHTKSVVQAVLGKDEALLRYYPAVQEDLNASPMLQSLGVERARKA